MKLSDIDKKLDVRGLQHNDFEWHSYTEKDITLLGCEDPAPPMHRFNRVVSQGISEANAALCRNTAGIRLRFATDSPYIALSAKLSQSSAVAGAADMAAINCSGFDLYSYEGADYAFVGAFFPDRVTDIISAELQMFTHGMHNYELNFPMFNGVDALAVGIKAGCTLQAAPMHTTGKRFVVYGSSISNGGCSSRPGTSYTALLGRMLDADYVNIGLSGNCLGEPEMAECISKMKMDTLLMEFDHNYGDPYKLEARHEPFFKVIRAHHPNLPVVFISRPLFNAERQRQMGWWQPKHTEVVRTTYQHAVDAGDKNVWFIDGATLCDGPDRDGGTADHCHPNDFGFHRMAERIYPAMAEALGIKH